LLSKYGPYEMIFSHTSDLWSIYNTKLKCTMAHANVKDT